MRTISTFNYLWVNIGQTETESVPERIQNKSDIRWKQDLKNKKLSRNRKVTEEYDTRQKINESWYQTNRKANEKSTIGKDRTHCKKLTNRYYKEKQILEQNRRTRQVYEHQGLECMYLPKKRKEKKRRPIRNYIRRKRKVLTNVLKERGIIGTRQGTN